MIREEYIFFDVDAASKEELLDFISEKALEFGITDSKEGLKDAFLKKKNIQQDFRMDLQFHMQRQNMQKKQLYFCKMQKSVRLGNA